MAFVQNAKRLSRIPFITKGVIMQPRQESQPHSYSLIGRILGRHHPHHPVPAPVVVVQQPIPIAHPVVQVPQPRPLPPVYVQPVPVRVAQPVVVVSAPGYHYPIVHGCR